MVLGRKHRFECNMLIKTVHSILPFHLQCTGTLAVRGFIEHVTNRSETEILIIGPDCSVSSQPVAGLAPFWNLVQVRYKYISVPLHHLHDVYVFMQVSITSTSPRLSNVNNFPTFLRPVASESSIAPGIVKLRNAAF